MGRLKIMMIGAMASAALVGTVPSAAADPGETVTTTVRQAINDLPTRDEDRTGYARDRFRHWVDADRDGCSTRAEVMIAEAVVPPTVGSGCAISGGVWHSYYDDADQTVARSLDVDHMVPLAEAWDGKWAELHRLQCHRFV